MHKCGESKTTRIMMATVCHVTSSSGLRKFQADGFLFDWVYHHFGGLCYSHLCGRRGRWYVWLWRDVSWHHITYHLVTHYCVNLISPIPEQWRLTILFANCCVMWLINYLFFYVSSIRYIYSTWRSQIMRQEINKDSQTFYKNYIIFVNYTCVINYLVN